MKFQALNVIGQGRTGFSMTFFENGWKVSELKRGVETPKLKIDVPGNVRLALMENNLISDPFIGTNNEESKWVSDAVWEYSNEINVNNWISKIPVRLQKKGAVLHTVFDGIDYDANFFVNGQKITRHVGMFNPTDVACGISAQSNNKNQSIKIRFDKQPFWRQHAVKSTKILALNQKEISRNFNYPNLEQPGMKMQYILDKINAPIDAWWRKYMIKGMELEKIREEKSEWNAHYKKKMNESLDSALADETL